MWMQLPSYTYLIFKHNLSSISYLRKNENLLVLAAISLTLLISPVALISLALLQTYELAVFSYLKWKLKGKFVKRMPGLENFLCICDNCTPCILFFVENQNAERLRSRMVAFLEKHQAEQNAQNEKIFYSWNSFMGHTYYFRNKLKAQDYVNVISEDQERDYMVISNRQELADLLLRHDSMQMPDHGRAIVSFNIYPNKIDLPEYRGTTLLCFKMHHCLADAKGITGWILSELGDSKSNISTNNNHSNGSTNGSANGSTNGLKVNNHQAKITNTKELEERPSLMDRFKRVLFEDRLKDLGHEMRDRNILRGYNLREERYVCWFSDQSDECMRKIREIRKLRPGVTFLDITNACITTSLYDYYKKVGSEIPKRVGVGVVLSPEIYSFKYGDKDYTLSNEFSCAGFYLPITTSTNSITERLGILHKEYESVKMSVDVQFNYWLVNFTRLLPNPVIKFISSFCEVTAGVSSFPGPQQFSIFEGCGVKDLIMVSPNSPGTGLHFVVWSYGSQFRLSLTADRSVIYEHAEAQSLIDNAIKHLHHLHQTTVVQHQQDLALNNN